MGEAVLIPKEKDRSKPELFRNITLTNASGKMFFQVLANRLLTFMVENKYIDQAIQKGFLPGIAGCIEHTQALGETLLEAKQRTKEIVVAWLDLANAYGSVAHNLIQFALEWYHVPPDIRELIHNYYDELFVRVRTRKWTTDWFMYQIGLFQGCPLSVVLFLIVFNLLLDLLKTRKDLGYQLKNADFKQTQKAYADDLTIIAGSVDGCKELLHLVESFLKWTRTMRAKPTKCKSLAMKKISMTKQNGKVSKVYTPYDAQLSIEGQEIPFIHHKSMRFLGQEIFKDLSDKDVRTQVETKMMNLLERTDRDSVNNIGKMWIYENHIVSRISWEFIIYSFPISFANTLEALATRYLKKWAGLSRSANSSILYRRRENKGLQLKALSTHLKCMQVVKYHIMKYAKDKETQSVYNHMVSRQEKKKNWNGVKELEERERHLIINELCRGQTGRQGLGYRRTEKRVNKMSTREHRQALSKLVKEVSEEQLLVSLYGMAQQGRWLAWETAMQMDTRWTKLLYSWSPEMLKFYLNTIQDTLPSPANLKIWNKQALGVCSLCGYNNCTMMHIFNCCQYSLRTGRYNWRHDTVLREILHQITPAILRARTSTMDDPRRGIAFKSVDGTKYGNVTLMGTKDQESIQNSNDWKVVWDEDKLPMIFPPEIVSTSRRPDITIYSKALKTGVVIELTVPAEENMSQANLRKKCKYEDLIREGGEAGWELAYFPVEVGARGFTSQALRTCFKFIGLTNKEIRVALDSVSRVALRATYTLWLSRNNKNFGSWELISRPYIPPVEDVEAPTQPKET